MRLEPLYFKGCPGCRKAELALRTSLSELGTPEGIEMVAVNTDEEAERLRFPGSPTIRVEGRDLFPEGIGPRPSWHLGCRVYRTPAGLKDHPSVDMILERLPRAVVEKR
jgi:hypothetical protein